MDWQVTGHGKQKAALERMFAGGAVPHALLLSGPPQVGKRIMANALAAALVVAEHRVLDLRVLEPERSEEGKLRDIPIGSVRELKAWSALRPLGGRKAAIIDDADRLGGEAANALLKLLEEPPAYLHVILVSGRSAALLPTVASRCLELRFGELTEEEMDAFLETELPVSERALLAALAGGRPGAARELLGDGRLADAAAGLKALAAAMKGTAAARIAFAKAVAERERPEEEVARWLAYARSRLAAKPALAGTLHGLVDLYATVSEPHYNRRLALEKFLLSS